MEDFPILLVFFIFYLIAGSSGKKKKGRRTGSAGPMRTRAQGEQLDTKAMQRDQQTLEGFGSAFEQTRIHEKADCEGERIHLDTVSQADMLHAAEGEDPCHGGNSAARSSFDSAPDESETMQGLRDDVLRGVIMSEILMRPHERRALQRSRRGYHG